MKNSGKRRYGLQAGTWLMLGLLSCSRPAPAPKTPFFDFATSFPQAQQRVATRGIDFGTEAARPLLVAGWSADVQGPDASIVWGHGAFSSLRFFQLAAGELRLRFRCRPYNEPGAPAQRVAFWVNGEKLGELELPAGGFASHELAIPAGAVREGDNLLELRYGRFTRPPAGPDGARDPRYLAVAWDWLALTPAARTASADAEVVAHSVGSKVYLPYGVRLDYFLPLGPLSRLHWREITGTLGAPPAGTALRVQLETAGASAQIQSFRVEPGAGRELDLTGFDGEMVRVSFSVDHGAGTPPGDVGLVLDEPLLVGPPPVGPSPEVAAERPVAGWRPPNIVLYLVDTLRADHLGVYGYERPVSPQLDAFAAGAVVFDNAYAQSGWTKTSVTSILTGLSPLSHRVLLRADGLPPELPTLQAMLHGAGYQTLGVTTNPTITVELGFARGFDHFVPLYREQLADGQAARAERVNEEFFGWLDGRAGGAPFFAYLHTMDPHDPYTPPEPYRSRFASNLKTPLDTPRHETMMATLARHPDLEEADLVSDLIGLYDGEIAANDEQFGRLLRELDRRGLAADTLIVFVSDHGEEFRDHGYWGHGHSLYREILHVPLVIRLPGSKAGGRRVARAVQHVDLLPTLLAVAEVAPPPDIAGQSLLAELQGLTGPGEERPVLSYLRLDAFDMISLIRAGRHLLSRQPQKPDSAFELYDLRHDPAESRQLGSAEPLWAGHLLGLLKAESLRLHRELVVPQPPIDKETEARLQALGYVR